MHEVFLQRLAAHPVFRNDAHLRVFLEYEQDLCAKPRGKMDLIGGLVSTAVTVWSVQLSKSLKGLNKVLSFTWEEFGADYFSSPSTLLNLY